jgi:hypothetical protein
LAFRVSAPATIDLAPIANPDDDQYEPVIKHIIEDPVVSDTQSVAVLGADELHHALRAWLIGETIDDRCKPLPHVRRKFPELSSGGRRKLESVSHVD